MVHYLQSASKCWSKVVGYSYTSNILNISDICGIHKAYIEKCWKAHSMQVIDESGAILFGSAYARLDIY